MKTTKYWNHWALCTPVVKACNGAGGHKSRILRQALFLAMMPIHSESGV